MKKLMLIVAAIVSIAAVSATAGVIQGQLGVLDTSGINPATGQTWAVGDTYRLIFVTSCTTTATSTDIATYNAFVQNAANAAGLGGATWNVVGSTATVDARDNTGTNPDLNGFGEAILLMDGSTVIANDYADLWNGIYITATGGPSDPGYGIYLDENGNERLISPSRIFTGSTVNGTAHATQVLGGSSDDIPKVATGKNYAGQYQYFPGRQWMVDFNSNATNSHSVYGMSETLTVVPEPATMVLLGLGGLGLIRRRRNG